MDGFYLGPLYIYTWGLTAAIGVIVAVFMAEKKVVSREIAEDKFWNLAIILSISVFLGARIQYILETWVYYSTDFLAIFRIWEGGFSFFGGVIGALLIGYIWGRINKINFLLLGWVFTPAWLFGMFFGRLGCSLIHDHLGKPTDLPWGIWIQGAYRHEPAMYEVIWLLLIGVGLWIWGRKSRKSKNVDLSISGQLTTYDLLLTTMIFPISLLLYSVGRFFIDFLRVDDDRFYLLTFAQWACIAVFIWTSILIIKTQKKKV